MTETATFTAIDLSRLPAPNVIEELSFEAIYAEMLARVKAAVPDFDDRLESDPAVRVLQVSAYFRMLDRQRVNDAARSVMVAFAQGGDLDHLGALVGVARLEIAPADEQTGAAALMEADDDFRRRIVLAPEAFSVAGPSGAYIARALSAHGDVLDASASSPAPACVTVYVLARGGQGYAAPELLATVTEALSGEDVRPIGDRLTVESAAIIEYEIDASLFFLPGPDAELVMEEARSRVQAYTEEQHRIGRDVTRSGIFAALHIPGVANVDLVQPAEDMPISDGEAAFCTGILLTGGDSEPDAPPLDALSLATPYVAEDALPGTVVSTIEGVAEGATLHMVNTAGGRFALGDNETIVLGNTPIDFDDAAEHNIAIEQRRANRRRVTTLSIAVIDAAGEATPAITSPASGTTPENAPWSMTLTASETVTWSIVGGADQDLFTLSGSTLSMSAKDFEAPADAGANNVYNVTIRATDPSGNITDQAFALTVTDADELVTTVVANPSPPDPALSWSSDFETVPDGTLLKDLPEWQVQFLNGENHSSDAQPYISGGKLLGASEHGAHDGFGGSAIIRNLGVKTQTALLTGVNFNSDGDGSVFGYPCVAMGVTPGSYQAILIAIKPQFGTIYIRMRDTAGNSVGEEYSLGVGPPWWVSTDVLFDIQVRLIEETRSLEISWPNPGAGNPPLATKTLPIPDGYEWGTYAGVTTASEIDTSIDALTLGGAAVYPALTLAGLSLTGSGAKRAVADIAYWEDEPTSYEMRVLVGSTVIADWAVAEVTANEAAGSARLLSATVPALYEGTDVRIEVRKVGTSTVYSGIAPYTAPLMFGANTGAFGGIQSPLNPMQVYNNAAVQSYYQDPDDSWALLTTGDSRLDANGCPLKDNLSLVWPTPNYTDGGVVTVEIEWTGGPIRLEGLRAGEHPAVDASILELNGSTTIEPVGNKLTFRVRPSNQLSGSETLIFPILVAYLRINEANPPKNITIYAVGADRSQRFTPEYLAIQNALPGPIRHMDGFNTNKTDDILAYGLAWSGRSRRSQIALGGHPLGIPLEDAVELSVLTNRPLWLNMATPFIYEGQDYARRAVNLVWNGVGSDISQKLSDLSHPLYTEGGNELWNNGELFSQAGAYIVARGIAAGRYPATFEHNGEEVPFSEVSWVGRWGERLWCGRELLSIVEEYVPRGRIQNVLGVQHGNPSGEWGWLTNPGAGQFTPHPQADFNDLDGFDCIGTAHYVGGDPAAGSSTPELPANLEHQTVADWSRNQMAISTAKTVAWVNFARPLGKKHVQYEFGFNIGAFYMTRAQEVALRDSPEWMASVNDNLNTLAENSGGVVCLYTDMWPISSGGSTGPGVGATQRWGQTGITGGAGDGSWRAIKNWIAAQVANA